MLTHLITTILPVTIIHICSLFILSALSKIFHLKAFIQFVIDFNLLPKPISRVWGSILPFLELAGGVLLLHRSFSMYGIIILSLLLISFSYGIIRILKSNRKIRCGCYGVLLDAEVDRFTLGKNIYLFLLLGLVLIGIMIPITPHYSIYSVGTGMIITLIILLTQKLWSTHRDAMNQLES